MLTDREEEKREEDWRIEYVKTRIIILLVDHAKYGNDTIVNCIINM